MTKKNRLVAFIIAVAVLFVVVSSIYYIAVEADHDCIGEGCPICFQISICENTLNTISSAVSLAALVALLTYYIVTLSTYTEKHSINITLVSLKVKLSD